MRQRCAGVLRLQALKRAGHLGTAEKRRARSGAVRIGRVALRGVARPAIRTESAGNGGRNQHAVAFAKVAHRASHFLDHANAFVADVCLALLEYRPELVTYTYEYVPYRTLEKVVFNA